MISATGRDEALAELHARPAPSVPARAHVSRLVFLLREDATGDSIRAIDSICAAAGVPAPAAQARHHVIAVEGREIRWERHTEFVTYTFVSSGDGKSSALWDRLTSQSSVLSGYAGLAASIAVSVTERAPGDVNARPPQACAANILGGRATLASDFQAGNDGFVTFHIAHSGLTPEETGSLCQRVLEIETYRMLSLMALPLARRIGALLRQSEAGLERITRKLGPEVAETGTGAVFAELNSLSAKVEAELATASFRFSAALAYGAIVEDRIASLQETPLADRPTPGGFLLARLTPALRTYTSMQKALGDLAQRNARATDLVRTRIDLELAQQNNALLNALNDRTRMQMRLQQTVEGLSVAAISYYIVGLVGYAAKGAKDAGYLPFDPSIVMAAAVPFALVGVWLLVRRVRRADDA